jgi:ferredoxin--NADP+ reductase
MENHATATALPPPPVQERWTGETVLSVRRWTAKLLSLAISRPPGFRFKPGHYARLGLADAAGAVEWRPLSLVSATTTPHLEFVAVLVPGGAFSARLAAIGPGAPILVDRAAYGFLTLDQLAPGRHLWLLASGTGLGPFVSMLRDPVPWQSFDRLLLVHSVREAAELVYRDEIAAEIRAHAASRARCDYVPVVTREAVAGALDRHIPQVIEDGSLGERTGLALHPAQDRVMVCGNPDLLRDMRALLTARGFQTSRRGVPGTMAFEKYW